MGKLEDRIERMEIKIDLLIDMVREVTLPKYYYASDKTQPLNTQPQIEERFGCGNKECAMCYPENLEKYGYKLHYVNQDTPEQTESDVQEWEEDERIGHLWELLDDWRDCPYADESDDYVKKINKNIRELLNEREREVLEEIQKEFSEYGVPDDVRYTHPLFYINGIIDEKLDKLNNKEE